jgi:hypothetical protein
MSQMTRPGASTVAVTASNSADIAQLEGFYPRALWVGGAGNVAIVTPDGVVNTITGVPAGTLLPIQTRRVNSTNTTATSMVAIY